MGEVGNLLATAHAKDGWAVASGPLRRGLFELESMLSLHLTIEAEVFANLGVATP